MNYQEKYQRITNDLIKKSFPELKNKVIVIEKEMSSKARARYTISGRKIFINPKLRKFNKKVIIGLLVHELSHFSINVKKNYGWFLTKLDIIFCHISHKHAENIEKSADLLAIKRGYKKELLATKKAIPPRHPLNYLSIKEVKSFS